MTLKYPEDFIGKIIQGDCLEVMRQMPDKCVDLVLTDPPYGIGEAAGKNKSRGKLAIAKDFGNAEWDNKIPPKAAFDEMRRISHNQVIFGGNYFASFLPNSSCWIVWDKQNGESDFADCELAWTSFPSAVRRIFYRWAGMLQENMKEKEQRVHPTQKPMPVMRWILERYAKKDQTIFDPYCGSGTTMVAAEELEMPWCGVDQSKEYCAMARKRIAAEQAQGKLF